MSTFNHKRLKQQELLAREDIEVIDTALRMAYTNMGDKLASQDRIDFLLAKLERMKK